jgi:hypothetical protein
VSGEGATHYSPLTIHRFSLAFFILSPYIQYQNMYMDTIFNQPAAAGILARLNSLQPDSKALWGKMNVGQMVSHLQGPVTVAMSDKKLNRTFMGIVFGAMAKKKVLNEKPFDKNLPTDPAMIRKGEHNFEEEMAKLTGLLNQLIAGGEAGLTQFPHPFFGKLTNADWGLMLWKHFDHHLRQFGA